MRLAANLTVADNLYYATVLLNNTCLLSLPKGWMIPPNESGVMNYSDLYYGSQDVFDALDGYASCFSADSKDSLGFIANITVANVDPGIRSYARGIYNTLDINYGPFPALKTNQVKYPLDKPDAFDGNAVVDCIPEDLLEPIGKELSRFLENLIAVDESTEYDFNTDPGNSTLVKRGPGADKFRQALSILVKNNRLDYGVLRAGGPSLKNPAFTFMKATVPLPVQVAATYITGNPKGLFSSIGKAAQSIYTDKDAFAPTKPDAAYAALDNFALEKAAGFIIARGVADVKDPTNPDKPTQKEIVLDAIGTVMLNNQDGYKRAYDSIAGVLSDLSGLDDETRATVLDNIGSFVSDPKKYVIKNLKQGSQKDKDDMNDALQHFAVSTGAGRTASKNNKLGRFAESVTVFSQADFDEIYTEAPDNARFQTMSAIIQNAFSKRLALKGKSIPKVKTKEDGSSEGGLTNFILSTASDEFLDSWGKEDPGSLAVVALLYSKLGVVKTEDFVQPGLKARVAKVEASSNQLLAIERLAKAVNDPEIASSIIAQKDNLRERAHFTEALESSQKPAEGSSETPEVNLGEFNANFKPDPSFVPPYDAEGTLDANNFGDMPSDNVKCTKRDGGCGNSQLLSRFGPNRKKLQTKKCSATPCSRANAKVFNSATLQKLQSRGLIKKTADLSKPIVGEDIMDGAGDDTASVTRALNLISFDDVPDDVTNEIMKVASGEIQNMSVTKDNAEFALGVKAINDHLISTRPNSGFNRVAFKAKTLDNRNGLFSKMAQSLKSKSGDANIMPYGSVDPTKPDSIYKGAKTESEARQALAKYYTPDNADVKAFMTNDALTLSTTDGPKEMAENLDADIEVMGTIQKSNEYLAADDQMNILMFDALSVLKDLTGDARILPGDGQNFAAGAAQTADAIKMIESALAPTSKDSKLTRALKKFVKQKVVKAGTVWQNYLEDKAAAGNQLSAADVETVKSASRLQVQESPDLDGVEVKEDVTSVPFAPATTTAKVSMRSVSKLSAAISSAAKNLLKRKVFKKSTRQTNYMSKKGTQ